ncbi:unnamed protein product, partial [Rangifer tarandus platyrhynchus]
ICVCVCVCVCVRAHTKNHVCYVCLLNNANNDLAQLSERKPDLSWVCVCTCVCMC